MEYIPDEAIVHIFVVNEDPKALAGFALVNQQFRKLANSDEVWRRLALQRWQAIPNEKDIKKNSFLPRHTGSIDSAADATHEERLHWRQYYWLRMAAEAHLKSIVQLQTALNIKPEGMAPEAPALRIRSDKSKSKKSAMNKGTPLSDSLLTPKNLFDMYAVGKSLVLVARRELVRDSVLLTRFANHCAAFVRFSLELFAHATDPSIINAVVEAKEWDKWIGLLQTFTELESSIPIAPETFQSGETIRIVLRLLMRVAHNCVGSGDSLEDMSSSYDHQQSSLSIAAAAVTLVHDIFRDHSSQLRIGVVLDESLKETVLVVLQLCGRLIQATVSESNWEKIEAMMGDDDSGGEDKEGLFDDVAESDEEPRGTKMKSIMDSKMIIKASCNVFEAYIAMMGPQDAFSAVSESLADLNDDWRGLYARLLIIRNFTVGTTDEKALPELIAASIKAGSNDKATAVRYQSLLTLSHLACDMREKILSFRDALFPVVAHLVGDSDPRIRSAAFRSAVDVLIYSESSSTSDFDTLLRAHVALLDIPTEGAQDYIQTNWTIILRVLNDIGWLIKNPSSLTTYIIESFMPKIRALLHHPPQLPTAEANEHLFDALLERVTQILACTTDRTNWDSDVSLVVEKLKRAVSDSDDKEAARLNWAIRTSWAQLSKALGADFAPYLEEVLEFELRLAKKIQMEHQDADDEDDDNYNDNALLQLHGHQAAGGDDDEDEDDDDLGENQVLQFRQPAGNEHNDYDAGEDDDNQDDDAMDVDDMNDEDLQNLVDSCGEAVMPYMAKITQVVIPAINDRYSSSTRCSAALVLPALLRAARNEQKSMLAGQLMNVLISTMFDEDDTALASQFDALRDIFECMPGEWAGFNDDTLILQVWRLSRTVATIHGQRHRRFVENILAGEVHMRGLDDSTLDIISETIDTLHSFLKKSPKGVARLLGNEVITEILGWLERYNRSALGITSPAFPFAAICIISQLVELGATSAQLSKLQVDHIITFAQSPVSTMAQASLYCLGLVAEKVPQLLSGRIDDLVELLQRAIIGHKEETKDNAVAALGRVLQANQQIAQGKPWYKQAFETYWTSLPLQHDTVEGVAAGRQLISFLQRNENFLLYLKSSALNDSRAAFERVCESITKNDAEVGLELQKTAEAFFDAIV